MYKIIVAILSICILGGCATKSPTQAIVDSGVAQIERSQVIIKKTETLAQCQEKANDSLLTAKENLVNAGETCRVQISNLESELTHWKTYFTLLVLGIGTAIYFLIINKLRKTI